MNRRSDLCHLPPSDACRTGPAGAKHHPDIGALLVLVFVQWSDCRCVDEGFSEETVGILDVCSALA